MQFLQHKRPSLNMYEKAVQSTCTYMTFKRPLIQSSFLCCLIVSSIGVNGKTWRIIKNWYEGGSCCVKLEDRLSNDFLIQRGVHQGSVLSPTLFLLVMDPFLKKLESASLGLKINDLQEASVMLMILGLSLTVLPPSMTSQMQSSHSRLKTSCNSILLNVTLCPFQDRIEVLNHNYPWMVSLSPAMMVLNAWAMFGAALSHPSL